MGLKLDYIYGQTPISEEEKEGLLIKSITTRGELDEFEQQNIEKAIEWTLTKKFTKEYILSEELIKELHRRMLNDVWEWAGKFRKTNKNLGVDKFEIRVEIRKLIDDCNFWIENKTFGEDEIAIRFKHRIVKIHPFPNGNGRHSRLLADIIVEKIFNKSVFSWGKDNISKPGDTRKKYINSLHQADNGNINSLIEFSRS